MTIRESMFGIGDAASSRLVSALDQHRRGGLHRWARRRRRSLIGSRQIGNAGREPRLPNLSSTPHLRGVDHRERRQSRALSVNVRDAIDDFQSVGSHLALRGFAQRKWRRRHSWSCAQRCVCKVLLEPFALSSHLSVSRGGFVVIIVPFPSFSFQSESIDFL